MSSTPGENGDPVSLPIDQSFLIDLLRKTYRTDIDESKLTCEIIGKGKGMMSNIVRVNLVWKDSGNNKLPGFIVIKIPTNEKMKKFPTLTELVTEEVLSHCHDTELSAYEFFTSHPPAPLPMTQMIYSERIGQKSPGMLILEGVESGRNHTFNESNNVEQTKTLLRHIVQVQAYALRHPEWKSTIKPLPFSLFNSLVPSVTPALPEIRKEHPQFSLTDDEISRAIDKYRILRDELEHPENTDVPLTLCIGDLNPNNMFWETDSGGKTTNKILAMIDFQIARPGSYATDVSSALAQMSYKLLETETDNLLTFYLDELQKATDGKAPVTFEEIKMDYLKQNVSLAVSGIPILAQTKFLKGMGLSDERIQEHIGRVSYRFSLLDC